MQVDEPTLGFFSCAPAQVAARRICVGKWGSNNGQACIAPDYILVEENIASKLVCLSPWKLCPTFFPQFHRILLIIRFVAFNEEVAY